jgi:Skp family chaperone for outer membrane proteins
MRLILISLAMLALSGPVFAQPLSIGRVEGPPIVILNQERLFADSLFGQRAQAELEAASSALSRQNRELEAALLEEEQALTQQRATMSAEEFRPLAEDFDTRAEEIRAVQAERLRRLRAQADGVEQLFFELITPILRGLLSDIGASAVLDSRVVIYVAEGGDVTDMALDRVNAELGDGGEEPILDRVVPSTP